MSEFQERGKWEEVNQLMVERRWSVNDSWLENFHQDPLSFPVLLSKYKFAAKMLGKNANVLELNCQHGMGLPILTEQVKSYIGVEDNQDLTESLSNNLDERFQFFTFKDFKIQQQMPSFDAIVLINSSKELIESYFFEAIHSSLKEDGKAFCGFEVTNQEELEYSEQLLLKLQEQFGLVVPFFMNGEVVQCGKLAHMGYIIYLCMQKRVNL